MGIDSILDKLREWFLDAPEDRPFDEVDVEYLRSERAKYQHMTIKQDCVRCDLCAKQTAIAEMESMIQHVAAHDLEGSAEVDPFAPPHEAEEITVEADPF